ncbi:hypothetical protein NEMBOFW57_009005 [Staphylotrichum longicolle]|uniref:Heterokaryon incompatibility domain-containing protein n=1 Tax=Staphylotrichum longicolle TaxID=669026 RepID=A0AAD4ESF0_9PEZI|nr:hypothetical protein NEMBOFW57_009005 [Staphylotrichum longicolle]
MSRWHKPGCATPDIVVDTSTQTPSCRACGATPDLTSLIREQAHASPFPEPPPDQPRGHFRLAYLSPPPPNGSPPTDDAPVHLTLEVYPLTNCPAYETVSYCWAGEDGDDTRCRPVYVGEYWDVMLHTRNCWEMLRSSSTLDRMLRRSCRRGGIHVE